MALSSSIQAYQDCLEFLEKALDEVRGARMYFLTRTQAEFWRMRCNQARSLHREENKRIHPTNTKMWGTSEYDPLMLTIKESDEPGGATLYWCYAQKMVLKAERVEAIPEDEEEILSIKGAVQMIEDQSGAGE